MHNVKYARGFFIVVKSWNKNRSYWTVVNTDPPKNAKIPPHEFHCHVKDAKNVRAAKMICVWADKIRNGSGEWPCHYPQWMQKSLYKVLHGILLK